MKLHTPKTRLGPILNGIALCLALIGNAAMAQQAADMESLEAAARRGDVPAMVQLAGKYEYGDGVAQDFAKSNELYCKAAARGNTDAMLRMGQVYAFGRVVQPDLGVSALFVLKAAELGNEEAQRLVDHVMRRTDSVLPSCMQEPASVATESPAVPAARKDIALLVARWAPEYAIDPNLVMALIAVESNFDGKAVSPKNAQGLMQLIPATAARFGVKNAYNPLENLKGGLAYLQWLMAYFKGEVPLVLAAYNAGEEAVERYRGVPPYRETRNYVKQITSVYKKASHPYLDKLVAPSSALSRMRRPD